MNLIDGVMHAQQTARPVLHSVNAQLAQITQHIEMEHVE